MACSFLTIVLSVLLQFTASDYPIGLFNFFLSKLSDLHRHM
jgi:hypothetical protein